MNPVQSSLQNYGAIVPSSFSGAVNRENQQSLEIADIESGLANDEQMSMDPSTQAQLLRQGSEVIPRLPIRIEAQIKTIEANAYQRGGNNLLAVSIPMSIVTSIGLYAIFRLIPPDSPPLLDASFVLVCELPPFVMLLLAVGLKMQAHKLRGEVAEVARSLASLPA